MGYIIYGINRVARDFIYIFKNLEIHYIVDNGIECDEIWGIKCFDISKLDIESITDKIIICDFDNLYKINYLKDRGLVFEQDFVLAEDFFESLDNITIPNNKGVAVWGTGNMSQKLMRECINFSPDIFIDSNKRGEYFEGRKVYLPEEVDLKKYFIVVAVAKASQIYCKLEEIGMKEGDNYCSFQVILGRPSELLRRTIFDQSNFELECHTMLNHLEILNNGATRCCCTTFVEQDMDNILSGSLDEVWKSNIHRIMCLSIENKTYSFCDKTMCPLFVDKMKFKGKISEIPNWEYREMEDKPSVIAVGYDPSCNLACSTCRTHTHFSKGKEKERIDKITEKVISEYIKNCRFMILAGDGEVFASQAYRDVYENENCNPSYIRLLTNGTLFTPQNWKIFKRNKTSKIMMTVSIDAATEETYSQIRRNGNFEKLKSNMEFASKLRKEGELSYLRFNFVVQKKNYLEIIPFIQWGEKLGVDEIFFTKILNWGTYSNEEFRDISMMQDDGVTPKKELLNILDSPIVRESKIVDLGTIQYSHKIDDVDIVENYYVWELEKRGGHIFDK